MAHQFSATIPPILVVKPGLSAGTVHQCHDCTALMVVQADNERPEGWQLFHFIEADGDVFMVFCPAHHTDILTIGKHHRLYP